MDSKRTEIKDLGEFGLIDRLTKSFVNTQESTHKGIGDDAAVIDLGKKFLVVTSDLLTEGIHFDLTYMPLKHLGYKSIVVNVSDVAAMNAQPTQVIVSIGISNRFSVEAVEELYSGIAAACEHYNVDLVGGDTTSSASGLIISVTALGEVDKKQIAYRGGAKENDVVCVTGDLGAAYIGLQILKREKAEFLSNPDMQPKLHKYEYIVQRQLKPDARTDIMYELKELKLVPTAMIDISDGLASELFHICKSSKAGVNIFEDKLPLDRRAQEAAVEFNIDPVTCMLNGGEDYELLFTIAQDDFKKIENHPDIHFIGYVTDESKGLNLVTKQENVVPLQAQGWEHF
jgi:thiamine-monophosphate kinase